MRSLLVLAFCGCGFQAAKNPQDITNADLAGLDFAGEDLAVVPGSDLASAPDLLPQITACALPTVLVTVENLHNPSTGGGRVARLSLGDGSADPSMCSTLTTQGLMTPQPFSAAWVASKIAVMGRDSLQLIDPQTDTIVWDKPVTGNDFPVDVFALKHPDSRDVVAAGWGSTLQSSPMAIWRVDGWGVDGSAIKSWGLNGADLPLGLGIYGMASYPKSPTHFLALDPTNHQWAWDVDPWSASKTALFGEATGSPATIYTAMWMTSMRTVWVDDTAPTRIYYYIDGSGAGLLGPITCSGCTLLHVVPDPTLNTRFIGLCDGPSVDARRVVRWKSTGSTCDTILEGALFGAESRLSRLAIAQ